jgi:hypothetical protein
MKKWLFLFAFGFLVLFFFFQSRSDYRHLKDIAYIPHFKKSDGLLYRQFKRKISYPVSSWMERQIENDMTVDKITLSALDATQEAILQRGVRSTSRYRIVYNKLYRYTDPLLAKMHEADSFNQKSTIAWFEEGLRTLMELTPLPNLDFLVTHEDGTRDPFYLVEDPDLQAPILGWAKLKTTPFLILIPDSGSLSTFWYEVVQKVHKSKKFRKTLVSWEEKQPLAFWRGGFTESLYRLKISSLSQDFPLLIDAGMVENDVGMVEARVALSLYLKPYASYRDHLKYKYLPVLDGVICSYPGYLWRLLSDSLVLKQESDQIQWFYGALTPYVHYLPIKEDLSDLVDQILWARAHDELSQEMKERATEFALQNLMLDDIYAYLYRVFIAYSRLQDSQLEQDFKNTLPSISWELL